MGIIITAESIAVTVDFSAADHDEEGCPLKSVFSLRDSLFVLHVKLGFLK
jgi:hypothetical protein